MADNVILCQIDRAEEPYYIDTVDLCVYSIEELCYFIDHNLPLIDSDFFDDGLLSWLEDELHLDRLTSTMERIRQEDPEHQTEGMILALNAECGWLYSGEVEAFRAKIRKIQDLPETEQLRLKADKLVSCGKYARAISVYKKILRDASSKENKELTGRTYHNMGVAYARFFQMEEACECMGRAYSVLKTADTMKDYLYCVFASRGREACDKMLDELKVDDATRNEINNSLAETGVEKRPGNIDEALNQWVRSYHREAGV